MKTKLILSYIAASALLIGGCTTQTNKPPAGTGYSGPVSNGQGGSTGGQQYANGGSAANGGSGANNGSNGAGQGAGTGSANGGNQNGGNGLGSANNGYGQGGTNSNGGRNPNDPGIFGDGSGYGGTTKSSYTPADLRDPRSILAQRIIYFNYNQSNIDARFRKILDAHGALLADFPQLNVRLEGHADERGSREYNVALSERRAYSVLDYLKIKGVKAGQADIVGYGEEVPAVFGHGEGSWSKNRRVEIVYAGE